MMKKTFLTSALDMPEIMSYIYSKSWKLQFSASSSIIIIEDYYLQTFLHSLEKVSESACLADSKTCGSYSNSIVPGGLLVQSYSTLFTPLTSLTILFATVLKTSHGIWAQSAVMKSAVHTARSATA